MAGFYLSSIRQSQRLRQHWSVDSAGIAASTPLLDNLAVTPRMALSMKKKLISTATNALRVRESAGSTEQDIGFSGALVDSAALATFVGANSGYLRTLYDQTGNAEDAVQTTTANQPRLVNSGSADAMATWDGTNDSLSIASLTAGAAQLGIYLKFKMPSGTGTRIIFEQSINYNNVTQSLVVYYDSATANKLNVALRDTTTGGDVRLQTYNVAAGETCQLSILTDRSVTGTGEIAVWKNGTSLTPTVVGTANEATGIANNYDVYIGARAGTSLFADMALESLVTYNADTSAIRSSIESIIA